ncbi:MAG: hypothetical protein VX836_11525 [Pseudomonadota bacterium]|nr:hypothetical protein [Pseudomonadota bacterium]
MLRNLIIAVLASALCACGGSGGSGGSGSEAPEPEVPPMPEATPKCAAYTGPDVATLHHYEGTLHEHSSYSDGDIHTIPADFYRTVHDAGYDYAAGSDHSDTLDTGVFISVGSDCFTTPDGLLTCLIPTADELVKWQSTANQASQESGEDFLAIRGFEWTSDRFGHINVYFSSNFSNAKTDGGYLVTMDTFWAWFTRAPDQIGEGGSITAPVPFGGGNDGLAQFNHPSDKCLSDSDAGCNWNDYELIPEAVDRMFGMEVYNDGNRDDKYMDDYLRALDKGWRLAPIGSEDEHGLKFGSEERPKTVTIAQSLDEAGFREAWLARRTYALSPGRHLRAALEVDHQAPMGAQLECPADQGLVSLDVALTEADGSAFAGEYRLYSHDGELLATAQGHPAHFDLPVEAGATHWYFVRAHDTDGRSAAYLAPVWISGR